MHVGVHKTGSTAFQHWLLRNRTTLADRGLFVPTNTAFWDGNFRPLAEALAAPEAPESALALARLRRAAAAHPAHDFLVSSERFSHEEFPDIDRAATTIRALGLRPVALMAVRDQIDWFNARHGQRRMMMSGPPPFDDFLGELLARHAGDWHRKSAAFERAGIELHVIPYAGETRNRGIVRALCATAPLATRIGEQSESECRNASLGEIGLIVADRLREMLIAEGMFPSARGRRRIADAIARRVAARYGTDRPFNGFTVAQSAHVASLFWASNEALASARWGEAWERHFPAHPPSPPSPTCQADLEPATSRIVARIADSMIEHIRLSDQFKFGRPPSPMAAQQRYCDQRAQIAVGRMMPRASSRTPSSPASTFPGRSANAWRSISPIASADMRTA